VAVERGIWEKARVFAGRKTELEIEQTELGIKRLGIRISHANYPKGKLIERLYGSLTDLFQLQPGYAGRNQAVDKWEFVQKQVAMCRSRKEHPSRFFLSKLQFLERLMELVEKLNNTPKRGKYHEGRTPKQVFEDEFTTPLVKIPPEFRQYFASNVIEGVLIGRNGVQFQFGSQKFTYKDNYDLGRLKGQRVEVRFSPENPAVCSIVHPSLSSPIVIEREPLASHKPIEGELNQRNSACANFDGYHKELYRSLQPMFRADFEQRMFRKFVADKPSAEFHRQINQQTAAIQEKRREENSRHARINRRARTLGLPSSFVSHDDESEDRGTALMVEAEREMESETGGAD